LKLGEGGRVQGLVAHQARLRARLRARISRTAISLDIFLPDMLGWTGVEPTQAGSGHRYSGPDRPLDEDRPSRLARAHFPSVQKPTTTRGWKMPSPRIKGYAKSRRKRFVAGRR